MIETINGLNPHNFLYNYISEQDFFTIGYYPLYIVIENLICIRTRSVHDRSIKKNAYQSRHSGKIWQGGQIKNVRTNWSI